MLHKSILIIGGGPVGLSLALSLSKQGKRVAIIDRGIDKSADGRVLALSYASYSILKELYPWSDDSTTSINTVEISHKGLGVSQINATELDIPCLGYTISYSEICQSLLKKVKSDNNIDYLIGEVLNIKDTNSYAYAEYQTADSKEINIVTADLLVLAEGGKLFSTVSSKRIDYDYNQEALIFHVDISKKQNNIAYERFGGSGPLVLLPYGNHYVVVWSLDIEKANAFKSNHKNLIDQLELEFTRRFGKTELLSDVVSFPLKLTQISKRLHKRVVIIGNSAQTVHPVSAQGLNLGLRDVSILTKLLSKSDKLDLNILNDYDNLRNGDTNAVIGFTHFLATKMETNNSILTHLRGAGIIALSNLPMIQNRIARSLIFGR